jgi:choline-glycine betaine transporter
MVQHEGHERRSVADRPQVQHLVPAAGITAVFVAVLLHLGGGAVLVHAGLSGVLASVGLGSGALAVLIVAIIAVKLVVVLGLRRRLRHG